MYELRIKRAYLPAEPADGHRILIDRLWPRGLSKEAAAIDEWAKEVTPSTALRQWFGHKEENFEEFAHRYREEQDGNPVATDFARHCHELLQQGNVSLIYGARSTTCNHARVLREWILGQPKAQSGD